MKLRRIKNNETGFSLIELILVLGLSSLIYLNIINTEKRNGEKLRAEAGGEQVAEVGRALGEYINQNKGLLVANLTTNGSVVTVPLSVLQGVSANGVPISGGGTIDLPGRILLPASFNTRNAFDTGYVIQIRNEGIDSLRGIVVTDGPIADETGAVRYDWLGYAARKAGASAGMTFFDASRVTGLNAGWAIPANNFTAINQAGQLAYRTLYSSNYDAVYLRRDGLYAMTGNLNMGNYDIVDATNITFNGWLSGNNAVLNNLEVGHIESNTMYNSTLIESRVIKGITLQTPSFTTANVANVVDYGDYAQFSRLLGNYSVDTNFINRDIDKANAAVYVGGSGVDAVSNNQNRAVLYAGDIRLGTGEATKHGRDVAGWLSDRVPRYVNRGIHIVQSGEIVRKPNCGGDPAAGDAVGTPKIVVTPQEVRSQGAVRGTISFEVVNLGIPGQRLYMYPNLYSLNDFKARALDNGTHWTVLLETTNYAAAIGNSARDGATYNNVGTLNGWDAATTNNVASRFIGGTALAQIYCEYPDM